MQPINTSTLKDEFLLDPSVVYLNHGSFGATPRRVFEKYQWWQRELERQPAEFLGRRFTELMQDARTALSAYIHAGADNIVYVPNATTAINIVARSLQLNPGDEILTTDHEYGAMDRTWRFVCRKTGAAYIPQPIPLPVTTAETFIEKVWAGVTPRTRVLYLSHITSPTALIFPVRELCRRAREAGIVSIIDGAHAVGQIPLDLTEIDADFYTSNLHKWLSCPKGSAFLYARPEMQAMLEPLIVSWGYESERPSGSRFIDEQEWTGTRDVAAYLSVPESIKFFEQHHWDAVRAQCHTTAQYAREQLTTLTELGPLSPDSPEWYSQMVSVPLPSSVEVKLGMRAPLQARLMDEFKIEIPVFAWQGKPYIRVSVQAYNSRGDVDRLGDALKQCLSS